MGMIMRIMERHNNPIAIGVPIGSVDDSPLMVVVNGTPASPIAPDMHNPIPGQAQHKTVAIVATIPVVLLFIQPPLGLVKKRKRFHLVYNKKTLPNLRPWQGFVHAVIF
jgi:hypothetical protein